MTEIVKVLPSLSEKGWVSDSKTVLAKILSFYILTDSAQSLLFKGNVINLPQTYQEHINEPMDMSAAMRSELTRLLERYFPTVEVNVKVKQEEKALATILLFAEVIDSNGVMANLGKVLEIDTEGLRRTVDVNNWGDGQTMLK